MARPLRDVCCACLPAESLPALAGLRADDAVVVALADGRAWVRWPAGDDQVLRRLLPVLGVELYISRGGRWHRHGRHLPALDFPAELEYRPLHQVLFPAPVQPLPPRAAAPERILLGLAPDDRPRRATALECNLEGLARWADTVSAVRLEKLQAAHCEGRVLLLGDRLPEVPGGRRFWGERLLIPLGYRTEPELPASAVRVALGLAEEELLILDEGRSEVVPRGAFQPLTRARLGRARGEQTP
jgi:hypothetical protein